VRAAVFDVSILSCSVAERRATYKLFSEIQVLSGRTPYQQSPAKFAPVHIRVPPMVRWWMGPAVVKVALSSRMARDLKVAERGMVDAVKGEKYYCMDLLLDDLMLLAGVRIGHAALYERCRKST